MNGPGGANIGPVISSSGAQKVRNKAKALDLGVKSEDGKSESTARTAANAKGAGDAQDQSDKKQRGAEK